MHLNITPTPGGMRQMAALFREQIARSEAKIATAREALESTERTLYDFPAALQLLEEDGLEAVITVEQQRIEKMREGLALTVVTLQQLCVCGHELDAHEGTEGPCRVDHGMEEAAACTCTRFEERWQ